MDLLTSLAVMVAAVAAIRGTWSPCGVSMLSSITPLTENGRGNRYWMTVVWFIVGTVLGGMTLGVLAGLGALLVSSLGLSTGPAVAAALVAALVTLASDLSPGGFRLPSNPRQVNRTWLDRYRSWVYGAGFGWQLGVGVATFVMSATVYLMVVLAALTGRPWTAFLIVTGFGLIRGLAILPAAIVRAPADLMRLHRTIERYRPASRALAVTAQIFVVGFAVGFLAVPVAGALAALVLGGVSWSMRARLSDPAPRARRLVAATDPTG
jgi:hypothetical protein